MIPMIAMLASLSTDSQPECGRIAQTASPAIRKRSALQAPDREQLVQPATQWRRALVPSAASAAAAITPSRVIQISVQQSSCD